MGSPAGTRQQCHANDKCEYDSYVIPLQRYSRLFICYDFLSSIQEVAQNRPIGSMPGLRPASSSPAPRACPPRRRSCICLLHFTHSIQERNPALLTFLTPLHFRNAWIVPPVHNHLSQLGGHPARPTKHGQPRSVQGLLRRARAAMCVAVSERSVTVKLTALRSYMLDSRRQKAVPQARPPMASRSQPRPRG